MDRQANCAPLLTDITNEVVAQHRFFVDWYQGVLEPEAFARFEASLGAGFHMVNPQGALLGRDAVVNFVKANRASTGDDFDIVIEDVRLACQSGGLCLATYVEVQIRSLVDDETDRDRRLLEPIRKRKRHRVGAPARNLDGMSLPAAAQGS